MSHVIVSIPSDVVVIRQRGPKDRPNTAKQDE